MSDFSTRDESAEAENTAGAEGDVANHRTKEAAKPQSGLPAAPPDILQQNQAAEVMDENDGPLSGHGLRSWWRLLLNTYQQRIAAEHECYDVLDAKSGATENQHEQYAEKLLANYN